MSGPICYTPFLYPSPVSRHYNIWVNKHNANISSTDDGAMVTGDPHVGGGTDAEARIIGEWT